MNKKSKSAAFPLKRGASPAESAQRDGSFSHLASGNVSDAKFDDFKLTHKELFYPDQALKD